MSEQNTKVVSFESASLFKELVEGGQIKNLRSVKSSPHPTYCFKATERVMSIVGRFMLEHDMKCDRSTDGVEVWDTWETTVLTPDSKPDTIATRNLRVVKRVVAEGYGNMLKRTLVDQYKKKTFVFYRIDRIAEIKAEEDEASAERYAEKQRLSAADASLTMENSKRKIDTHVSDLVKKMLGGRK